MVLELTQERLKEMLHYDPDTGVFTWLVRPSQQVKAGTAAGCPDQWGGYHTIKIKGKLYRAHRLAWFYVTGDWPKNCLVPKNGDHGDSRFRNLREVGESEIRHSRTRLNKNNTSGFPGVVWHRGGQKWEARITILRRSKYLGLFDTPEEAHEAYLAAKARLHPFQPVPRS